MKKLVVVAVTFSLAVATMGCASATADPTLRRKAANVALLTPEQKRDLAPDQYTMIQEVVGVSCGRQAGSDPSLDAAREMLRLEAAKVNADAVVDIACEETGVSWKHNCWKTIECRGDAIRYVSKRSGDG